MPYADAIKRREYDRNYKRKQRPGRRSIIDRIKDKINADCGNGCWNWLGTISNSGYGQLSATAVTSSKLAHRVIYTAMIGPVLESMDLDHLCRNRKCVNPTHLEPVSRRENICRGNSHVAKQMALKVCPTCGNSFEEYYGSRGCKRCYYLNKKTRLRPTNKRRS